MKTKSILSGFLVFVVILLTAFAAVPVATASQDKTSSAKDSQQSSALLAYNTTRVSVAGNGAQASSSSFAAVISGNNRYVAFSSFANNLVGDADFAADVFVHDRQTGETTLIPFPFDGPLSPYWALYPSLSSDGRYVVFSVRQTETDESDIYVHDRNTSQTTLVSVAMDGSRAKSYLNPVSQAVSADGRYVVFSSDANNLVSGDTNGKIDVFVRDTQLGVTTRVSVTSGGAQANDSSSDPSISADGRYVAFESSANNLVAGDTNGYVDVFVHDRSTGATILVSRDSSGTLANNGTRNPSISADGRYVAFVSDASNLVLDDTNDSTDIFVYDLDLDDIVRVSVTSDGAQADSDSYAPSISADGRYIAFESASGNLVPGYTGWPAPIYVHDRQSGETFPVPNGPLDFMPDLSVSSPSISGDGQAIAFVSASTNLVAGDTNGADDIFVYGRFGKSSPSTGAVAQPLALTLSWQAISTAASYQYCYSSAPGPCSKWNSVGGNTSVVLSGLAPNYTYYWQVRAINADGSVDADDFVWWSFTTASSSSCGWPSYTPPGTPTFGDVPMTVGHWSWVERLANATITAGCGNGNFCPFSEVVRAQMAIFLLRAKHCGISYVPPAVGDSTGFSDVPLDVSYAAWVKQLAAEGVTAGCGGGNFCP